MPVKPKSEAKTKTIARSKAAAKPDTINLSPDNDFVRFAQNPEEKYQRIIENIHDGYFETDLSGNFSPAISGIKTGNHSDTGFAAA